MRCLGLDVGAARVGIAVSDEGGTIAFPLDVVSREKSLDRIRAVISDRNITVVVMGESRNLDGSENPVMKDVRDIAAHLEDSVRVVFEPEQFSTQAAARLGKGSDAEAATLILQSYLDRHRDDRSQD